MNNWKFFQRRPLLSSFILPLPDWRQFVGLKGLSHTLTFVNIKAEFWHIR